MAETAAREKAKASGASRDELVAAYKRLLQEYIDRRPSGLRLKIASHALRTRILQCTRLTVQPLSGAL